ncbi:MAG TPA: FkbM family methyltransferase [Flavobacterium sp.]|uniref:FkbM family methyltransferase n=1 Tax=unclassified Flavobacterium TaxID=196869 RepID=UPI0025C2A976|nr:MULTISPECIES: FkbM family methyltransferase [unclassified Flavobacterium]HRE79339.1 FkbM family methyltransferase [Flavobacterium sp.]
MKLKKVVSAIITKLKYKKQKFLYFEFNGKMLKVIKGTFSEKKDSDEVWFNALAQNSSIFFDVGCNIGKTALIALTHDKIEQVVMIDTNSEALNFANLNVINNNFIHKTRSFLGFVSDKNDEELDFYTVGHGSAGSMFKSHAETASILGMSYKVHTITLDSLVQYFKLIPDFIKIDVEGAEFFVLNGAKETVKANKLKILVEMHSNKEMSMKQNTEKVLNWCNEVGYSAWYLTNKQRLIDSEPVKHRGRCHFLLIPEGDDFPTYL